MAWWSRKNKATDIPDPQTDLDRQSPAVDSRGAGAASESGGAAQATKRSVPTGLFQKCDGCQAILDTVKVKEHLRCCPSCGHHFSMPTQERLDLLMDAGSFVEEDATLTPQDPLQFRDTKGYADRLVAMRKSTGQRDAFRWGMGRVHGQPVAAGFFVFEFMGGSMGSVVGEKITRLFERAREAEVPALLLCASGGARMQEGILSLMQMAKTTAALARLKEAGLPYVTVLLHPTTGGVAASFAMLGDVALAEPGALIGFAGPRVIEQTIRQKLPAGFQRAEFLLQHGMVDAIVPRRELKARLGELLSLLMGGVGRGAA